MTIHCVSTMEFSIFKLGWLKLLLVMFLSLIHNQCIAQGQYINADMLGSDIDIYRGSIAWDLARAVQYQRATTIKKIIRDNPNLLNYREPRFGKTLLLFAVQTHRYKAARALAEAKADVNLADKLYGTTPLIAAAGIDETSDYVRLLLDYGANPNLASIPADKVKNQTTPLIEAAYSRLESVKLLLEKGADINYITPTGHKSALYSAFSSRNISVITYFIVEKKANHDIIFDITLDGDTLRVADMLKRLLFPLDSRDYVEKMKLVRYLEGLGVDYRSASVPKRYYRIYSKDYLEKY